MSDMDAPEPTRCHECEKRAETWILVYLSDVEQVPVCLPCAQLMGWLPEGRLVPEVPEQGGAHGDDDPHLS